MMKKLSRKLLQKSLQRLGWAEPLAAVSVLELFNQYLNREFGRALQKEVEAKWVRHGSLGIRVSNGPLRQQFKDREKEIISYLNSQQQQLAVKRLRFLL